MYTNTSQELDAKPSDLNKCIYGWISHPCQEDGFSIHRNMDGKPSYLKSNLDGIPSLKYFDLFHMFQNV